MIRPLTLAAALAAVCLSASVASAQQPPLAPTQGALPSPGVPLSPGPEYRNGTMRTAGIVLTSIAAASAVGGAAMYSAGVRICNGQEYGICNPTGDILKATGSVAMPFSVGLAGIGAPLWAMGARPRALTVREVTPPGPHRNNAMRIAGIVLTAMASATAIAGIGVLTTGFTGHFQDEGAVLPIMVGSSLIGGSAALAAAGVSLGVVGGTPAPQTVPAVSAGPRSIDLRWTF
jgi:hypothetical protein